LEEAGTEYADSGVWVTPLKEQRRTAVSDVCEAQEAQVRTDTVNVCSPWASLYVPVYRCANVDVVPEPSPPIG
jgi:hypothetical protein